MRDLTIREAREADRPAYQRLMGELQDAERALAANRRPADDNAPYCDHVWTWTRSEGFVLLAEIDGEAVGMLAGGRARHALYVREEEIEFGEVSDLSVAAQARGKGVGRALLEAAETRFRSMGLNEVCIGALASNAPANALYAAWAGGPSNVGYSKRLDAKAS